MGHCFLLSYSLHLLTINVSNTFTYSLCRSDLPAHPLGGCWLVNCSSGGLCPFPEEVVRGGLRVGGAETLRPPGLPPSLAAQSAGLLRK